MDSLVKTVSAKIKRYIIVIDISNWKHFKFWEKMFLYFCLTSVLGKIFEIIFWQMKSTTFIPFAQPYGFGTVAVIMFVLPLIQKKLTNPFSVYWLNTIIAAVVEYLCAFVVVWIYGSNIFWDYSSRVLNINGYTCIEAAMLFGILATVFIYVIYPITEKMYSMQKPSTIHILSVICLAFILFDTVDSLILR